MSVREPDPQGSEDRTRLGRSAIIVMVVAFTAWLLTNVDQSLFGYAAPAIQHEFGIGLTSISLLISASFLAGMVLPIGVGVLTDTWGARWTLPICLGLSALLVGAQGLSMSFAVFAGARILSFGLSSSLSPITNALAATASPTRYRPMVMAILQCAYPLGWLVSSIIVAPLIEKTGWRTLFFIGFAIVPVALVMGWLIPPAPPRAVAGPGKVAPARAPLRTLFSPQYRKTAVLCGLAFFFNSGAVAATTFYLPTFLHESRGYSVAASAIVVGSSYGVSVAGYIGSALVSMFLLNRRDTIILWTLLAAVLFLATIWLPRSYAQDLVAFCVMGIFYYGATAILITYLLEVFPSELRATAAAVCGTACVSGSLVVFPVVAAQAVARFGWQSGFALVVAPALLMSTAAMLGLPRLARPRQPPVGEPLTAA